MREASFLLAPVRVSAWPKCVFSNNKRYISFGGTIVAHRGGGGCACARGKISIMDSHIENFFSKRVGKPN